MSPYGSFGNVINNEYDRAKSRLLFYFTQLKKKKQFIKSMGRTKLIFVLKSIRIAVLWWRLNLMKLKVKSDLMVCCGGHMVSRTLILISLSFTPNNKENWKSKPKRNSQTQLYLLRSITFYCKFWEQTSFYISEKFKWVCFLFYFSNTRAEQHELTQNTSKWLIAE